MFRQGRAVNTWDLTKYYGKSIGLESVYLETYEGETFGLLGLGRSGKTTIINLLLGLLRPTRGRAEIFGMDCHTQSHLIRRAAGCVPEMVQFYGDLTGKEYLDFCRRTKSGNNGRVKDLIEQLNFNPSRKFSQYSQTEKKKAALIQALMNDPNLIILDNPTTGLDPLSEKTFFQILSQEKKNHKTILFSTDSPTLAVKMCDRIGILHDGHLKHIQDMNELQGKIGRKIRVVFQEEVSLEDFITEDVSVIRHQGREWDLSIRGPMGGFIKRLSRFNITDLTYFEDAIEDALVELFKQETPTTIS